MAFNPTRPPSSFTSIPFGENVFDLRFWRDEDTTRVEIVKGDPAAVIQKSYAMGATR